MKLDIYNYFIFVETLLEFITITPLQNYTGNVNEQNCNIIRSDYNILC